MYDSEKLMCKEKMFSYKQVVTYLIHLMADKHLDIVSGILVYQE